MAKVDDAFELISGMTILEARDLVKKIEDEFGVTAATATGAAAPGEGAPVQPPRRRPSSRSPSRTSAPTRSM